MKAEAHDNTEVFPDILTLLEIQRERRGGSIAIESSAADGISFADLHQRATRLAKEIQIACRPFRGKRTRVGIVLLNGPETAVALLGAAIAGTALPFNPSYLAGEFELYFHETRLDALLVDANEAGPCVEAAAKLGLRVLRIANGGSILGISSDDCALAAPAPDDVALVLLTSGSTGRAKCVPLTHRNLCTSTRDVCRSMALSESDRCLAMWEQYHVGGLVDLLLVPLASGGKVICTGGFNAAEFYRLLAAARPTWTQCVPTTLNELLFHADRLGLDPRPSSLRLIRSVAATLPPSLKKRVESSFGVPVIQTFGMTEAGPLITSTRLPPAINKPKSVGFTCGPEVRILGSKGETLPPNEIGEIAIRGANVFSGYENDTGANQLSFRDGWFLTGDIGFLDAEGELFLTGRFKQLINRGGEKVNPQEIDDALLTHPAVVEAAAFPVKHRTLGEDAVAAVVLRTPVEARELRDFLLSRLASFKVPRRIEIRTELPRNGIGKIDRLALAEASERALLENRSFAPPRTDLESFLARLWAAELDLEQVGIHDDFAALGGDSLSSLRLLVAAEKALGIAIPDAVTASSSTVAQMAEQVGRLHRRSQGTETMGRESGPDRLAEVDAKQFFRSLRAGSAGELDNLDDAYRRLQTCDTVREMNILGDAITVYTTPDELTGLLDRTRDQYFGRSEFRVSRVPMILLLKLARWRWRRKLERNLGRSEWRGKWERSSVTPDAFLYGNPTVPTQEKILIIAFGGNAMRLMMPTYGILCNLDPARCELLLLKDPHKSHYSRGIEGVGDNLDEISLHLQDFVEKHRYRRAAAFGTSSGGIPALYVGVKCQWNRVVAVGADRPDSPRHSITPMILEESAASFLPEKTAIRFCFSAGNKRDREAAVRLSRIFPGSTMVAQKGYRTHNLLWELYQADELGGFLTQQCIT